MSAVGLLVILLVMGALAVAVLVAVGGSRATTVPTLPGVTTLVARGGGGASPTAGNAISRTEKSACQTNFDTVQQAISYYQTVNGQPPASIAALSSILKDPVSSPSYTITIDPHRPGQIDVATKGHPATAGDANCAFA